ncbi:hypothetical protein [Rhodococcus sp. NPDC003348]
MSRNLARRGASVLVAAALLGGGLALGGGTASAEEYDPYAGDLFMQVAAVLLSPLGSAAGPIESGSAAVGNTEPCHGVFAEEPEPGCFLGVFRVLPDELAAS